jgi:hypothetical protein
MFTPTLKTPAKKCTNRCTGSIHVAQTTPILAEQSHRMYLKTPVVESKIRTVAPNVAGSIPVSHPKLPPSTAFRLA